MSKNLAVIISPNYKDYATTYLVECLDSLKLQSYQDFTVYMVDNETTEESYRFLKNAAPEAQIIRCVKNEGFAGGNNRALD